MNTSITTLDSVLRLLTMSLTPLSQVWERGTSENSNQ
jgi:hypothetical protein